MKKIWETLKKKFMNKQFLTFGMIGVCNTLISQGLYMLFVSGNVAVSIASVLGDVLSMVFSYFMNIHFTYHQKPNWKSAVTFPLSYIPGVIISAVMVVIVVDCFHGPTLWAKLISLPIYFPLNFLCMNLVVKRFGKKTIVDGTKES